eukprot:COSAG02_NODE_154_length_33067_cov_38.282092_3_plen_180_part_00
MRVNSYIYVFKFNLCRILRRVHRVNLRTVLRTDHACGPDSRAAHLFTFHFSLFTSIRSDYVCFFETGLIGAVWIRWICFQSSAARRSVGVSPSLSRFCSFFGSWSRRTYSRLSGAHTLSAIVSADCPSVASRLSATLIPELRYASVSCMGLGHQHHWVIKGNRVDWRFVHNLGICCFLV